MAILTFFLDNIELKFKYKQHAGSIHDMVICENFLITIASNGEFIIWEISADKGKMSPLKINAIFRHFASFST
jgi:hypothetical protein